MNVLDAVNEGEVAAPLVGLWGSPDRTRTRSLSTHKHGCSLSLLEHVESPVAEERGGAYAVTGTFGKYDAVHVARKWRNTSFYIQSQGEHASANFSQPTELPSAVV